jgi:hypothetical protein
MTNLWGLTPTLAPYRSFGINNTNTPAGKSTIQFTQTVQNNKVKPNEDGKLRFPMKKP